MMVCVNNKYQQYTQVRVSRIKASGVALVQVLITTTIIMLLMLYFLTAAKSQVGHARALQDKTQAYLSHYSTQNAVLFRLLTSEPNKLIEEGWNFYGEPFEANKDAMVEVQDLNGLLSLATTSKPELIYALLSEQIAPGQAMQIAASMVDWIDADDISRAGGGERATIGNGPIQTFTELPLISGMTYEAEQILIKNTTVHPTLYFNPMVAPPMMLAAYLNDRNLANDLVGLRGGSNYTKDRFEQDTGLTPEDGLDYIYGPSYRITINSQVGDSYYGKVLEFSIYRYRDRPVRVLSRMPLQQISNNQQGK